MTPAEKARLRRVEDAILKAPENYPAYGCKSWREKAVVLEREDAEWLLKQVKEPGKNVHYS